IGLVADVERTRPRYHQTNEVAATNRAAARSQGRKRRADGDLGRSAGAGRWELLLESSVEIMESNWKARSRADWKRSAGFFSRKRRTTRSRAGANFAERGSG